jgi:3-hydroxybutyryl-CoA dehydrogenase
MGHGIAQVCARAGSRVWLHDVDQARVDAGLAHIKKSLDKGVEKGKVTAESREETLGRIRGTTDAAIAASEGELLIEAIPENLALKQALFRKLDSHAEEGTVFATNTSSLSVAKIAEAVSDPSRVIGTLLNPCRSRRARIVFDDRQRGHRRDPQYGAPSERSARREGRPGFRDVAGRRVPGHGSDSHARGRRRQRGGHRRGDGPRYCHPIGPLRLTDMVA